MKTIHVLTCLMLFGAASARADKPCPDLSGNYQSSYVLFGVKYDVSSKVTQKDCALMQVVNHIASAQGTTQYERDYVADGIFRRKDDGIVSYALFTPTALLTYEVRSPKGPEASSPIPWFSRRDIVFLDRSGNLVNSEERYDEQGKVVGTDQFVYVRVAGASPPPATPPGSTP